MDSILSSATRDLLSKALDVCAETHKIIANNIANIDSQNFRSSKVDFAAIFEGTRQAVLNSDDATIAQQVKGISSASLAVKQQDDGPVSLDQSMVELTENTLRFHALTDMRKGLGSLMKIAIKGSNS